MQEVERMRWIDVGKGAAMVLVVLLHCSLWIENEFNEGDQTFWYAFSAVFGPVRMPLFFLISGYLSTNALLRPLKASNAKTIGLFYLYALWTALFIARLWVPLPGVNNETPQALEVIAAILLPTSFWYLWALVLFFIVAWLGRQLLQNYAVWLLAPLFLLSLAGPAIDAWAIPLISEPLDALKFGSMAQNAVWFCFGAYCRPLWDQLIRGGNVKGAIIAAFVYASAFTLFDLLDWVVVGRPALAILGLLASGLLLSVLPLNNFLGRNLERVGSFTLPVYIFHIFFISMLSGVVKATGFSRFIVEESQTWGFILPPILTLIIVWLSMLIGKLILASPLKWTLSPAWLKSKVSSRN